MSIPRPRRLLALLGATSLALTVGALAPATPAGAASGTGTGARGQTLTVSDVDDLDPAGTSVTVTGRGYTAAAGFDPATEGMYVAFCVDQGATQAPSPCVGGIDMEGDSGSSRWVTNNGFPGVPTVPIAADGSFTTTIVLDADDGTTDCFDLPAGQRCKVVTRMDHRASGDRSQDVKVPVGFTGQPLSAVESFVTAAHVDFLGARPTPAQLDRDATALSTGQPKASYLRAVSTSDAWLAGVVNDLYQDTLGRDGDADGVAFWTGRLRGGGQWTVARVAASFYASAEYFEGIGGNTNRTWIEDLYRKVLLRPGDTGGVNYWVGQVGQQGRVRVAERIYQSRESAETRVKGLYRTLLGRAPEPDGLAFWSGQVVTKGDLALAVNLANSSEYARRAESRFP